MLGWNTAAYAAPRRGLRLARDRDRRPRRRRDRRRLRRGGRRRRPADRDHRPHEEGQGRHGGRGQGRLARQAARRTRRRAPSRSWAASATSHVDVRSPTSDAQPHRVRRPPAVAAAGVRARREGGDAQGLRRRARRARRAPRTTSSRSTARSATRPTPRSSTTRIPDRFFEMYIAEQQMVAAAVGMQVRGWTPVRLDLRGLLHARLRLHPHGRDPAANIRLCRLARRRLDRRGRPVADGARGPGDDARRPRQRPCSTRATRTRPRSSSRRWPTATGISYLRTTREKTPVLYAGRRAVPDRRQSRSCARPTATT